MTGPRMLVLCPADHDATERAHALVAARGDCLSIDLVVVADPPPRFWWAIGLVGPGATTLAGWSSEHDLDRAARAAVTLVGGVPSHVACRARAATGWHVLTPDLVAAYDEVQVVASPRRWIDRRRIRGAGHAIRRTASKAAADAATTPALHRRSSARASVRRA